MTDTALLLLDLQVDFLQPHGRMPLAPADAAALVTHANSLIAHATRSDWEVIFIKNEFPRNAWLGNFFRRHAALAGSPGAALDPRLIFPPGTRAFPKSQPDAFTQPALASHLHAAGIRHLVILGVMAEGCVRATVTGARQRGFAVTAVTDAIGSTRSFLLRFGLDRIQKSGAALRTTRELTVAA